jgi:four helix bundle protein
MNPSTNFTGLIVWQKAHQFTVKTYFLTKTFPKDELYGLTSQFRRAAVSVAANIAEGFARRGLRDKLKFFNYSKASLQECKYYLLLAKDLNYQSDPSMSPLAEEVGKLLYSYCRSIQRSVSEPGALPPVS